jgi:hypothetical protein
MAGNPFDVGAFLGGPGAMNAFSGEAMRTWLDAATRMQAESVAFWTGRVSKDVAAMTALAQCTSPTAAMEAQVRYATEAWSDFQEEGRRLMRIAGDASAMKFPTATGT